MLAEPEPLERRLATRVRTWRTNGHACDWRELGEILRWTSEQGHLRAAQLDALETYWYLRLVLRTPHMERLYRELYPDPGELAMVWRLPREIAELPAEEWRGALASASSRSRHL